MNYLIYGNSYKLIDNEIEKIVKEYPKTVYFIGESSLGEIIEDVSYNSLFDERKVIVVRYIEKLFKSKSEDNSELESLLNYLNNPNENVILIFVSYEKINSRSKLNKEILSKLTIIETPIYEKSYELVKAIDPIIRKDGYVMSQNALNLFVTKCNNNYDIVVMEFEKLKKIKKTGLITEDDINNLVCNYNMDNIFGFKDAVLNKDLKQAVELLDDLEASKVNALPLTVMLEREYETLYDIKYLSLQRLTNEEISIKLNNMHPFRVKTLRSISSKYSLDDIEKNIEYLCDLDYRLVSEDNLGIDEIRKFLITY